MYYLKKTIHQLFEEQVKKTPNNIAIVFENKKITYKRLNEMANQFAHGLIKAGLKNEEIVAIVVGRSIEMIISIIGTLKAGGCCQLIDQMNAQQRILYMLENSKVRLIIKNGELDATLKLQKGVIEMQDYFKENLPKNNPNLKIKPKNLAFIVYTSGSTGLPKGVMIEHQGVINSSFNRIKNIPINNYDCLCLTLPTGFVALNHVIFSCLFVGATLHIYSDQDIRSIENLYTNIDQDKTTILDISFQMLSLYVLDYLEVKNKKFSLKNLRVILPAGEKLKQKIINLFLKKYPKVTVFNTYGMSEFSGTIFNAKINYSSRLNKIVEGLPPINDQVYVLNKDFNIQPVDLSGEVFVSGYSLARGYLNQPDKTREVFLPHPFINNQRIYKTGDIGKMLPDGNIEIIGRVDHQVKIRGNRVELGEIEAHLNKLSQIKQAVVIAKEEKNKHNQATSDHYLVAYYMTKSKITSEELRSHLKTKLPGYMIPSYFIQLDKFPLNANGKLDRLALPEPDKNKLINTKKYQPPTTDLEKKLVEIWQEVLGVKKIGINDNFFELGGHSLKIIILCNKINKKLKRKITLINLFQFPSISSFIVFLNKKNDINYNTKEIQSGRKILSKLYIKTVSR